MSVFLPNGLGDYSTGDSLAYAQPLLLSGNVWYVDTANGTDAVSPKGLNAAAPLLTLSQAITNAANGDIIVIVGSNGAQLTSAVTINKSVTIVGSQSTAGEPASVWQRSGGAAVNLFTITAADVQLRGLTFGVTETSAVATARIAVSGARFRMVGCVFEMGANDTGPALSLASGADSAELRNCEFTNASSTTQPESALKSSAALTCLRLFSCSFDGGSVGFSNYYAIDLSAGAVTRIEAENLGLLNGADMKLHASSTGFVHVADSTGGARVDW